MQTSRIAVVIGSTREGRFGPTVARWFAGVARQRPELDVDVVDLLEAGVPGPRFTAAIDAADGVVIVVPEYNHSFPIRETVSFAMAWEQYDGDGRPKNPEAGRAAHRLLNQLVWWAVTLRAGRTALPYAG